MGKESELSSGNPIVDPLNDSSQQNYSGKKKNKKGKKPCVCKGFSNNESSQKQKNKIERKKWFQDKMVWKDYIKKHTEDLKNAKPVVDDKPPRLNISSIYDVEVLNAVRESLRNCFDLNINMVKMLYTTAISQGKTDTFTFDYKQYYGSNFLARKEATKYIEKENKALSHIIKNPMSRMPSVKDYAEEWERNEALMEINCQFPLFWKVRKEAKPPIETGPPVSSLYQFVTEKSAKYPDKRPRVFFEVSIANVGVVGKMVAMLYSDYVPMTVKNFLAFCNPKASLTYKGNLFYLIFQNFYCQTGDVVENRGYGGTSIYGPYFRSENFILKHSERGILTMHQKIPNRNESQFLIIFRKLDSLNGENVVFGKIIRGLHVLDSIEGVGSKKTGRPKVKIYISDCDEI